MTLIDISIRIHLIIHYIALYNLSDLIPWLIIKTALVFVSSLFP